MRGLGWHLQNFNLFAQVLYLFRGGPFTEFFLQNLKNQVLSHKIVNLSSSNTGRLSTYFFNQMLDNYRYHNFTKYAMDEDQIKREDE